MEANASAHVDATADALNFDEDINTFEAGRSTAPV